MRVVELKEFVIECDACGAKLAFTSEDVQLTLSGSIKYVICPICGEHILF